MYREFPSKILAKGVFFKIFLVGATSDQKMALLVQISFSSPVVFLSFISWFALVREQIDRNTPGWVRKFWMGRTLQMGLNWIKAVSSEFKKVTF